MLANAYRPNSEPNAGASFVAKKSPHKEAAKAAARLPYADLGNTFIFG
jgi:hypothetical protein